MNEWTLSQIANRGAVSAVMSIIEADVATAKLRIEDFLGTQCRCNSSMKRKSLSIRAWTSVSLPQDREKKISNFREFVTREACKIPPEQIRNINEVPVPFAIVMNRTVEVT